jgi:putative Ca2+/H+ antiporter (TMEM165/GDT1 family)
VKTILLIFGSVLLAELGDKTQLATMLYATDKTVQPLYVFLAAAGALVVSTFLAVMFRFDDHPVHARKNLKAHCRIAFIAVGIWTVASR